MKWWKKVNILEVGSVGRMLKTRAWDKNERNIKTGEGGKGGSCWIFTHEWNVREMYMCVASMWSVVGGWKVEVWLFAGWVHCGGCTDKPIKMSYLWRIDIPWRVGEMCILVDSRVTKCVERMICGWCLEYRCDTLELHVSPLGTIKRINCDICDVHCDFLTVSYH